MSLSRFFKTLVAEGERLFGVFADSLRGELELAIAGGRFGNAVHHDERLIRQNLRRVESQFGGYVDPEQHGAIAGFRMKGAFLGWTTHPFSDELVSPDPVVAPNAVCNAALNDVLSVYLVSGTQKTTWYLAPINNSPTPTLAAADTAASHAGWAEVTDYTSGTRVTWTPDAVSGQSVSNTTTTANFTINTATIAIYGAFLISNSTKGGSTGILFATGAFGSVQNLVTGQTLKVTYTCPASAT